ncbi:condensation domain-containing protein [Streptomyces yangpuensis]|uniref:Condensation domain-containing protein n=1 Tax=Streptomyces yangpuensis TaxID=1648182 RepID=A0ABY5PRT7_9ACTN|nr:condensation domain-containing protein [Streptomyces yangpuensis]UUY46175.1 condensation domain-containing protein [Streptomyces yangpuensis]
MLSITSQYLARYRRLAGDRSDTLLPVTGAQRRFVLVRSLDPSGRPDLVPMFFAFPYRTIDPERLRAAARRLAARHTALRSRVGVVRGTPVLSVPADPDAVVTRPDLLPGESPADAIRRALASWDAQGPAMRILLVSDEEREEDILAVVLDHAACDGRSLARIVDELGAAYDEDDPAATAAPEETHAELAAYRDAVLGQLAAEERAETPEAAAYWADRLRALDTHAPAPSPARVPEGARPSGAAQARLPAHDGGGVSFPGLLDACRSATRELYGTDRTVPLGYPWGGRPTGAEPVIGCFLNTLVFPVGTGRGSGPGPGPGPSTGTGTGSEATADAWWDDLDRADVPFDAVVTAVRSAGSRWTGGLDGLLTVDDDTRRPPLKLAGAEGREIHVDGRPVRAPFALSVTQGAEIRLRMVWDRAVLDDETAHRAFDALTHALRPSDPTVR